MAQDVVIRLRADPGNFTATVEGSGRALQKLEGNISSIDRSSSAATASLARMGHTLAASLGGRELAQAADAWSSLNAQLKIAAGGAAAGAQAYGEVLRIAMQTGQSLEQVGGVYKRFAENAAVLNINQQQVAAVSKTVAQAMALSGGSAESAHAALVQFGQALAAGRLRGEELNSVLEQAPRLARTLADGLGVPIGKLRELAEAGEITSEAIVKALAGQAQKVAAEFDQLPLTIGRALTNLRTAFTDTVGSVEQSTGAFRAVAEGIDAVAQSMGALAVAGGALGAVMTGRVVASLTVAAKAKLDDALAAAQNRNALAAAAAASEAFAAAKLAEARATAAAATGMQRLAATQNLVVPAQNAATQAAIAAAAAQRGASTGAALAGGALAALGGPVGLVTTALTLGAAAWVMWGNKTGEATKTAARAAEENLDSIIRKVEEMNQRITSVQRKQYGATLSDAEKQLGGVQAQLKPLRYEQDGLVGAARYQGRGLELQNQIAPLLHLEIALQKQVAEARANASRVGIAAVHDFVAANAVGAAKVAKDRERLLSDFAAAIGGTAGGAFDFTNPDHAQALDTLNAKLADLEKSGQKGAAGVRAAREEVDQFAVLMNKLSSVSAGLTADFAKDWDTLAKAFSSGRMGSGADAVERLAQAQAQLLSQQPGVKRGLEDAAEAANRVAAAEVARGEAVAALLGPLESRALAAERELQNYGLTESQIEATTLARYEEVRALAAAGGASAEYLANLDREIEARKRIVSATSSLEARRANEDAARDAADEWQRTAETVERSLTDALMRGFESGQSFGENLRDALVNMFRTLVLRPIIQPIAQGMSGFVLQGLGMGGGGAGGGGFSSLLSGGSTLYNMYNAATTTGVVSGYSALSPYAMTAAPVYEAGGLAAGVPYGSEWAASSAPTYGGSVLKSGAQFGSGWGGAAAGLAGGLWAYNQTGSYTAGVGGAAVATAGYGALTGALGAYSAGTGIAAGAASGAAGATGLGFLGPWGWAALAVAAILGDVLAEEPDPRIIYQMRKDLMPDGVKFGEQGYNDYGWEDAHKSFGRTTASSPFGFVGMNINTKDVDAQDQTEHFKALAQLDTIIAARLSADEIDSVRTRMDGWTSSHANRRNGEGALNERLMAIAEGIGGDVWADVQAYATAGGVAQKALIDAKWDSMVFDPNAYEYGGDPERDREAGRQRDYATSALNNKELGNYLLNRVGVDDLQKALKLGGQTLGKEAAMAWMESRTRTEQVTDADGKTKNVEVDGYTDLMGAVGQNNALFYGAGLASVGDSVKGLFQQFELLKVTMPSSVEGFRSLLEGVDLTTEAGRELYLELSKLAPSFADLAAKQAQAYATLQSPVELFAVAQRDLAMQFDSLGLKVPTSVAELRTLIDGLDTTTASGAGLRAQLLALIPAFAQVDSAMLSLIGTTRDDLTAIIRNGLGGKATAEETAAALSQSVTDGIWMAMANNTANQVADLMISGIINPAIQALLVGGNIAAAVSAGTVKAVVDQITAQVAVFNAVMSDPLVQAALASVNSAWSGIGVAVSKGVPQVSSAPRENYFSSDNAGGGQSVQDAWRELLATIVSETKDATRELSRIGMTSYERAVAETRDRAAEMQKDLLADGYLSAELRQRSVLEGSVTYQQRRLRMLERSGSGASSTATSIRTSIATTEAAIAKLNLVIGATAPAVQAWTDAQLALLDAQNSAEAAKTLSGLTKEVERLGLTGAERAIADITDRAQAYKDALNDLGQATTGNIAAVDAWSKAMKAEAHKEALRAAWQRESTELERTIDRFDGFAEKLREFRESLVLNGASPLTSEQKYSSALREFSDVSRRAMLGDEGAIEKLQSASGDFLNASRDASASAADYARDFGKVQGALLSTEALAQRQSDVAQGQLDAMRTQVSLLVDLNENVLTVADAIRAVGVAQGLDIPAFAAGGLHAGGLRLVGEYGPELEVTGPARYWSADQTRNMFAADDQDDATAAEVRQLRAELRAANAAIAQNTLEMAKLLRRWNGDGMPETRAVA